MIESPVMPQFCEVRDPVSGNLLFRYDPGRALIEIKHKKAIVLVDLAQFHQSAQREAESQPAA